MAARLFDPSTLILLWLVAFNVWNFSLMGYDKRQARRGGRRTPELTFFAVALLGGAVGGIAGMYTFRHKTRHWYFKWGLPAILVLQVALALWLILR